MDKRKKWIKRKKMDNYITFIQVSTRQFPTKCAEYPTPLLVLKLNRQIIKLLKGLNRQIIKLLKGRISSYSPIKETKVILPTLSFV